MSARRRDLADLLLALYPSASALRRFLVYGGYHEVEHWISFDRNLASAAFELVDALEKRGMVSRELFETIRGEYPLRESDIREVAAAYGIELEGGKSDDFDPALHVPKTKRNGDTVKPAGRADSDEETVKPAGCPDSPEDGCEPDSTGRGVSSDEDESLSYGVELPDGDSAASEEHAEYLASLDAQLNSVELPAGDDAGDDYRRWPWIAAAAVLDAFRPLELRPLPPAAGDDATASEETALTALADRVVVGPQGLWVLTEERRTQALARLFADGQLADALAANRRLDNPRRDRLESLIAGEKPELTALSNDQLDDLSAVLRWLDPLDLKLPVDRQAVHAAAQRRVLIDPLRKLAGKHFRGRRNELRRLRRHVRGQGPKRTLVVRGPGGVGKSSLLGKVLLELEDRAEDPQAFAYVDFDRAIHDPRQPRALLEAIALQLRLLYGTNPEAAKDFAALESVYGGDSGAGAAYTPNIFDKELTGIGWREMVPKLAGRLDWIHVVTLGHGPRLVLVFDTFEEVQLQGPGAVEKVIELVAELRRHLPEMRVVVSGRADLPEFPGPIYDEKLGDLDRAAARSLLRHLKVTPERLRREIVDRFGGNPLTLALAAEVLTRAGAAAFDDVAAEADALAEVAAEQVQGMLYSRILGHLKDPEVVVVAHPGLVVRRVTEEVLRHVLAGPCGLDRERAPAIFERLRREVSLFEIEADGALRHRQDVRCLMLRTMDDDPERWRKAKEIHRLAVKFYAARSGDVARAEELYHRLMRDEPPRSLDQLWSDRLRRSLAPAWDEPLPVKARSWLGPRLGLAPAAERDLWEQEDWEADAASRARSWLASAEPQRTLDVLRERPTRIEGSHLYALEARALLSQGRLDEARAAFEKGTKSAIRADDREAQLELREVSLDLSAAGGDDAAVIEAGTVAAALADRVGEPDRALDALLRTVESLGSEAAEETRAGAVSALAERFSRLPRARLQERPERVRQVLKAAGAENADVLIHAALELGDSTDEKGVFRDDAFALSRLLKQVDSEMPAMRELARELGLRANRWSAKDLAQAARRRGRTGKALAIVLGQRGENPDVRRQVLETLVR